MYVKMSFMWKAVPAAPPVLFVMHAIFTEVCKRIRFYGTPIPKWKGRSDKGLDKVAANGR